MSQERQIKEKLLELKKKIILKEYKENDKKKQNKYIINKHNKKKIHINHFNLSYSSPNYSVVY